MVIPAISYDIIEATQHQHFEAGKFLFQAYQAHLDEDLCFQSFESELNRLSEMYAFPSGALLLAKTAGQFIGCVAIRRKERGVCEMKRLYVIEQYKGRGIGKALVSGILEKARELGYHTVILDTLQKLKPALQLYQATGFEETPPYYANPLKGVIYMKKRLT